MGTDGVFGGNWPRTLDGLTTCDMPMHGVRFRLPPRAMAATNGFVFRTA